MPPHIGRLWGVGLLKFFDRSKSSCNRSCAFEALNIASNSVIAFHLKTPAPFLMRGYADPTLTIAGILLRCSPTIVSASRGKVILHQIIIVLSGLPYAFHHHIPEPFTIRGVAGYENSLQYYNHVTI